MEEVAQAVPNNGNFVPLVCQGPAKAVTLRLVMENSLTKEEFAEVDQLEADDLIAKALKMKTVHLEWLGIVEITNLDAFEATEALYMQYNRIERIEGLESMARLNFLALQNNRIAKIENLLHLRELEFLDLSHNRILQLEEEQIPSTVNMLSLKGNVCANDPEYEPRLRERLPDLVMLDGVSLAEEGADAMSNGLALVAAPSSPARPRTPGDLSSSQKLVLSGLLQPTVDRSKASSEEATELDEPSTRGLAAYYKRDELRTGALAKANDLIQAYAMESLADTRDFSHKVEEISERSMARRRQLYARPGSASGLSSTSQRLRSSLTQEQLADIRRLSSRDGSKAAGETAGPGEDDTAAS